MKGNIGSGRLSVLEGAQIFLVSEFLNSGKIYRLDGYLLNGFQIPAVSNSISLLDECRQRAFAPCLPNAWQRAAAYR